MDFTDNPIARLFDRIQNDVIHQFVLDIFNTIAADGTGIFAVLSALFFLMIIALMAANALPFRTIVKELAIYIVVTTIAVSWGLYEALIYDLVIEAPAEVASIMFSAVSNIEVTSPDEILIVLWRDGITLTWIAIDKGSIFSGLIMWYFLGVGFFLVLALAIARAVVLLLGIMLAQAIALAIGPFVLFLAIFEPLRGLLEQWIRVLVSFMMFRILVSLAVILINIIVSEDLRQAIVYEENLTFELVAGDLLVMIIAYSLFTNAQHMGRSIAHGINAAANGAISMLRSIARWTVHPRI